MTFKEKLGSFGFLLSTRFWAMTLGIVAGFLGGDLSVYQAISAFGAGFVGIATFDKSIDKISGAKIEKVFKQLEGAGLLDKLKEAGSYKISAKDLNA